MSDSNHFQLSYERDFGEKINGSFVFLSQNFKQLMGIVLRMCGPVIVGSMLIGSLLSYNLASIMHWTSGPKIGDDPQSVYVVLPFYLLILIAYFLITILIQAAVFGYMKIYASDGAGNVTFNKVWNAVKPKLAALLIYKFILLTAIVAGYAFAIFPGIYLQIVFSLFAPVFIIENKSFTDSVKRCFEIISEKWWSTFGLMMVMGLIISAGSYILYLPMLISGIFISMNLEFRGFLVLLIASGGLLYATYFMFAFALENISTGLQYYNLTEKIDGYGLRRLIEMIGTTDAKEKSTEDF